VAKYKPGKSGVASRKIKKLKEDIKSESDKDRIKELEQKLAILMAKTQQDKPKTKKNDFPMYGVPRDYDGFMNEETMAERRAGASQRDLEQGISRIKGKKNYQPLPKNKKGGGKIYASMNKKYGGGIYPRKVKM
jgi:hypothetical protein